MRELGDAGSEYHAELVAWEDRMAEAAQAAVEERELMPIATTDLVQFASANMPDIDTGTSGGAIDTLRRSDFTQIAANDTIQALSSSAGDTMNLTVEGRNAAGQVVTETKALTGTTAITFSTLATVERSPEGRPGVGARGDGHDPSHDGRGAHPHDPGRRARVHGPVPQGVVGSVVDQELLHEDVSGRTSTARCRCWARR
jgi:hypothetical protein